MVGCEDRTLDASLLPLPATNDLVECEEVVDKLASGNSLFLLDVRPIAAYHQGHIPGAVHVWRDAFTRDDLPYSGMAATRETIQHLLDSLGLRPEQQVVVYDDRGGCDAARLWWLLRVNGHRHVSLLNGGIPNWRAKGHPLSMEWVKTQSSGYLLPFGMDSSLVATIEEVERFSGSRQNVLLDTRSEMEYSGAEMKPGAFRAGTIPGSVHFDWGNAVSFDTDHCIKDTVLLKQQLAALGIDREDTVITFCHSGVRSAHTTFVLTQLLGMKNVRNYDGSWTEWSYHSELPLEFDSSITKLTP